MPKNLGEKEKSTTFSINMWQMPMSSQLPHKSTPDDPTGLQNAKITEVQILTED